MEGICYKPIEERKKNSLRSNKIKSDLFLYVVLYIKEKNIQRMFEAFNDFNKDGKFDLIVIGEPCGVKISKNSISPHIKILGRKSGLDLSNWVLQ